MYIYIIIYCIVLISVGLLIKNPINHFDFNKPNYIYLQWYLNNNLNELANCRTFRGLPRLRDIPV